VTMKTRMIRPVLAAAAIAVAGVAAAQYPPQNWAGAPTGKAWQPVFPYPGQCSSDGIAFGLPQCTTISAPSFKCDGGGFSNQTSGTPGNCGSVTAPPGLPLALLTGDTQRPNKYLFEVLNPLDYSPDTTKYPGADYYEIAVHEAWGFQGIADAGLFPNAKNPPVGMVPVAAGVPNGKQWTGITDSLGNPLFTPIWGVGQVNKGGGPVTTTLQGAGLFPKTFPGPFPSWSQNKYVATWPSISIRAQFGRPVVVKWINEFPNNHLFCPHPEAADWPCAIDRTFMGVKYSIDPQKAPPTFQNSPLPYDGVNQYGSPMQPDNSWVTHLHGGEIPPQTDGFAEKWFGNAVTGKIYSPQPWPLDPVFHAPPGAIPGKNSFGSAGPQYGNIFRPGGPAGNNTGNWSAYNFDTYAYPLVNREATIWFHDHTLGKTHHNVIAGPAGFFPVIEPSKHGVCSNYDFAQGKCVGTCKPPAGVAKSDCEYSWIDPVTDPRGALGIPKYDLFFAIQDRDFNADGTINFPNGMANVVGASGYNVAPGNTPAVPGPNPQVHPVWVPEYFASNALVNGVIWPKKTVEAGFYRVRLVNGSDARCYQLAFNTTDPWSIGTPGRPALATDISFTVVANEQGYLKKPVPTTSLVMCPGERYEFILDFTQLNGNSVYMINDAGAPFPNGGNEPFFPGSPYADMATIMRFDVGPAVPGSTVTSLPIPQVLDLDFDDVTKLDPCPSQAPADTVGKRCIAAVRNLYLTERVDGTTGASLGLQINGVPFEYDVTETPIKGTYEQWNIINLTVDAHPMHPHLGRFQIVKRQDIDVAGYKLALCQSDPLDKTCTPGTAPGGVMQLIPDVNATVQVNGVTTKQFLQGNPVSPDLTEAGWKDAMRALPGQVLTFVGKWDGGWKAAATLAQVTAPGAGNTTGNVGSNAANWSYPDVTSGPYVWHCHINSHEDSEMMRTSLVVKP
jgi:FtsP/CotA-like multicopper oxidase with cupredoxin domain